jgi:hypothetical protein
MIVRGLIWHEWCAYVPNEYVIRVMSIGADGLHHFREQVLSLSPGLGVHRSFANGAFNYTATRGSKDSGFTAWHISFYGRLNMVGDQGESDDPASICAVTGPKSIEPLVHRFLRIGSNEAT